jgi:hypothetical protein
MFDPIVFEYSHFLNAAKHSSALGLDAPPKLLALADEVIE